MIVFVRDSRNRVLSPTTKMDWVKKQLKSNKARHIKGRLLLIQLNYPVISTTRDTDTYYTIGLDSGYKNVGFSIFKISKNNISKLFAGEVTLRTEEIRDLLQERKMYRNIRRRNRRLKSKRTNTPKFRHPRWKNRRNKLNLNPTIRHIISSHVNIVKKILKYIPIERTILNLEYFKFDKSIINEPGTKSNYTNVRYFVMARDQYQCQYNNSHDNNLLEVHHKIPRSEGGSDNPSNLITLCSHCHNLHHQGLIDANKLISKQYKDQGVLNTAMPFIYRELAQLIPTYKYYGYETADARNKLNISKSHINDANTLARFGSNANLNYIDFKIEDLSIIQIRRHSSRAKVSRLEDRKYIEIGKHLRSEGVAKNRNKSSVQKINSLKEFRNLGRISPSLYSKKVIAIPGRKVYRAKIIEFNPGDLVKNTINNTTTFIVKGNGSGYKVYGFNGEASPRQNPKTSKPQTATIKIKSNSGLNII
jgi:hypothetical protein